MLATEDGFCEPLSPRPTSDPSMTSDIHTRPSSAADSPTDRGLYRFVAVVAGLWGVVLAYGGLLLVRTDLRQVVAGLVADGRLTSATMSDAALLDAALLVQQVGGVVLAVLGVVLLLGGLGLVLRGQSA